MEALPSYVLITPARNEASFIPNALESVTRQTLKPLKWVIVSDGSTDATDEIVSQYAHDHAWIELVRKPARKERHFAAKVEAFNIGYDRVKHLPYEVIGNLDADISFDDEHYFEVLMGKFRANQALGVGGTFYREGGAIFPSRFTSLEDVFGACQMFRRECFEQIGGYSPLKAGGIDVIAFLSAREKGWQTRTFSEMICHHHRQVASEQHRSPFNRMFQAGRKDYLLGSHPLWELLRGAYQLKAPPVLVGGVLMLAGYFAAMITGVERTVPKSLAAIRQRDQMQRLNGIIKQSLALRKVTAL
jgi:glycosyltransferase involved in cell wall biosynthesis